MAKSGHTSVASLARYARPSAEALARWQEWNDRAQDYSCSQPKPCDVTADRNIADLSARHREHEGVAEQFAKMPRPGPFRRRGSLRLP